ncbi:MAG: putative sulfate/molybdate transporter [Thermoplasmata archaeon]
MVASRGFGSAVSFNRNELAGAFGDIGTDLPLILGMVAINGLDATSAFVMFGVFQILTAFRYGLPMPVQPLKAMAALMIATGAPPEILFGGGLVVGAAMLVLSLTGAIDRFSAVIPEGVVRGIQLGLGMSLMLVAFSFMQRGGTPGLVVAFAGVLVVILLGRSTRFPPALILIGAGVGLSVFQGLDTSVLLQEVGLSLPKFHIPSVESTIQGGITLAIPQIPLSVANSVIATSYLVTDLFPGRRDITPRKISMTYALINLTSPFFSGVPVCHGSGGLAGHYRFGARTGGSVLIYGAIFLILGLFFGNVIFEAVKVFPFPILGALLFFEGFALVKLITHVKESSTDLLVALLVGVIIIGLPYGYVIGMLGGSAAYYLLRRRKIFL